MLFFIWLLEILFFENFPYLFGLVISLAVVYHFTSFPWLIWRLIGIPCAIFFILTSIVIIGEYYSNFFPRESLDIRWVKVANLYGLIYLFSEFFNLGIQTYKPVSSARRISVGRAIPLLQFTIIYIVFSVISQYLFIRTSGGASGFAEIIYFSWIFPLFWLILLGSRFYRTEKLLELYFWKLVLAILVLQVFTLFFNFYICIAGGSYNFIQALFFRLAVGKYGNICTTSDKQVSEQLLEFLGNEPWVPHEIVFLARVLYYILNLILILIP